MTRPLIALVGAQESVDGANYLAARSRYVGALTAAGECAVVILGGPDGGWAGLLDRFDGVLLAGHQSNIGPAYHGGEHEEGPYDDERDRLALSVLPAAVRAGLPVFGICRGIQELNVAFGGTVRDLRAQPEGAAHREDESLPRSAQYLPRHEVLLAADGLLADILGSRSIRVNSLHQQAVGRLAPGLRREAVAPDGVVEAVSLPGAPAWCLAVQWHPEWYADTDPVSRALFGAFVTAAAKHAAERP